MKALSILIFGHVQGVFFRASAIDEACTLGVEGWVQNRKDGGVEMFVQGEDDAVEKMLQWCFHGPGAAKVTSVTSEEVPHDGTIDSFEVRG